MKSILHFLLAAISCSWSLQYASAQTGVRTPSGELILASDGTFYGTSTDGGETGNGTLFQVTQNSEVTIHVHFSDAVAPALGAFPKGSLVSDSAGNFWGTTEKGGQFGYGTVFKFDPDDKSLTTVHNFTNTNGAYPVATLLNNGSGQLIGTTTEGGAGGFGTIFQIDTTNNDSFTLIAEFTGETGAVKGANPIGGIQIDSMGVYWGTTSAGGAQDSGTIFRTNLTTVTTLVEFTGTSGTNLGASPQATMVSDGSGSMWGTTFFGGSDNCGTIFKINTTTDVFATVYEFDGTDGSGPAGRLMLNGTGGFVGTTKQGGDDDLGTIFSINFTSNVLTGLLDFTGTSGAGVGSFPVAGLISDGLGSFWGTTTLGGNASNGTIFKIDLNSGDLLLIVEPYDVPSPPTITVAAPPTSGTTGAAINLTGTADPEFKLKSVLVSLDEGLTYQPATLVEGASPTDPVTWTFSFVPAAENTVWIKSVDSGGDISDVKILKFKYASVRPDEGIYNGLATPAVASTTPFKHSGFFTLKVLRTGKFTGKLLLNGQKPVALKGSIDSNGIAQFGKLGAQTSTLTILRGTQPTQVFALSFAAGPSFAAVATATVSESSVVVSNISANEALYTSKKNPVAPMVNVPTSLLNPLTDKGSYTGVFKPLDAATQGMPATDFPQGSGFTFIKVTKTGKVSFVGKLADGSPFAAAALLTEGNIFPLNSKLYTGKGALNGLITFQDTPGQSDADGTGLNWYKPASIKNLSYPLGWIDGIQTDFVASKCDAKNWVIPSSATITINHTELGAPIDAELAITTKGITTVLDTDIRELKVKFTAKGAVTGSYLEADPAIKKPTLFSGVVLQKSQSAAGFFLVLPPLATPTLPKQSGSMEITTP